VTVDDVTADQFADDGTGNDVGREVLERPDPREPHSCCESIGAPHRHDLFNDESPIKRLREEGQKRENPFAVAVCEAITRSKSV